MRGERIKFSVMLLLVILGLSFILATHDITPESFSVNETISNLFNFTVTNTDAGSTANITHVNITIPSNFTFVPTSNGTTVSVSVLESSSTTLNWSNVTDDYFLIDGGAVEYFWFNATATPGTYNITVLTVNSTGTETTNISVTVNDTTNPTASLGTNPVDNANSSTAANVFDLKCTDAYNTSTMELWGNWSGDWAVNNTNSSTANDTYSNITVTLSDGVYLWGAYCNDSTGNEDWSDENRTLIVDTTPPTPTATCTPATVFEGSLSTCTCTGTDATSRVNASLTTATNTSYPRVTGAYTYTCSITDYSGNSASDTATYNVIAYGGSPSGSTNFWTGGTQLVTDAQFEDSFSKELSVKARLKVRVSSSYHYVGIRELTATTATIEITSDPQQAILSVGDERKFEVSGDNYYDILVKLNSIENNKADITIQSISELITSETAGEEEQKEEDSAATKQQEQASTTDTAVSGNMTIAIIIAIIIIIIIVSVIYGKSKKKQSL